MVPEAFQVLPARLAPLERLALLEQPAQRALGGGDYRAADDLAPTPKLLLSWRRRPRWPSAGGIIVSDGQFWFTFNPPYDGTINSLTYLTGGPGASFNVDVEIDGTPVTGLTSLTVSSSTPTTASPTGANTFVSGQPIKGIISGTTGSPIDAMLSLFVTWM